MCKPEKHDIYYRADMALLLVRRRRAVRRREIIEVPNILRGLIVMSPKASARC